MGLQCFRLYIIYILLELCSYGLVTAAQSCSTEFSPDLTEIYRNNCGLTSFDVTITTATHVYLHDNRLTEVPSVFQHYPELDTLFLSNNSITRYPSWLVLPSLKELALHSNPLEAFHTSKTSLPKLEILSIGDTQLKSFPSSIRSFSSLRILYINGAGIGNFDMKLPSSLEILDISNNLLTTIPSGIYNLKNLTTLHLQGNVLDSFSLTQDEFNFLNNLKLLYMSIPLSATKCEEPGQVQELKFHQDVGEQASVSHVCVTGPFNDSGVASQSAPTSHEISNSEASQNDTNFEYLNDNPTSKGLIWLHILLTANAIGLFLAGSLCWCCLRSRHDGRKIKSALEVSSEESNAPETKYTQMPLGATAPSTISMRQNSPAIARVNQNQRHLSANSPLQRCTTGNNFSMIFNDVHIYRISIQDLTECQHIIGVGGFANVHLVKYRNKQYLASKRLHSDELKSLSALEIQRFARETEMASKLKHSNIVEFIGVAWDDMSQSSSLQMLFEYMEGGDLKACLSRTLDSSDSIVLPRCWCRKKFIIARDIAVGLAYLHSFTSPILHRDLKAKNILLSGDYTVAKLGDFGLSRIKSQDSMSELVGTCRWLAPEVAKSSTHYNESSDIYSYGQVLKELETHEVPYFNEKNKNNERLRNYTILYMISNDELDPMKGFRPDRQNGGHEVIYSLAQRCLATDPDLRPSAMDIVQELQKLLKES